MKTLLELLALFEQHSVLTAAAAFLAGLLPMTIQQRWHHRTVIQGQREGLKDNLRLKVFEEVTSLIKPASRLATSVSMKVWLLPSNIQQHWSLRDDLNAVTQPMKARAFVLQHEHYSASEAVGEVLHALERYEIIIPGIKTAREEIGKQSNLTLNLFSDIFPELLRFLPFEFVSSDGNTQTRDSHRPSSDEMCQLIKMTNAYHEAMLDLGSYLMDLSNIIQNALLGGLFNRQVAPRKPLEPEKYKVLMLDD